MNSIDNVEIVDNINNEVINLKLVRISIIVFNYDNNVDLTDPKLEIVFENNKAILFDGINGGENLAYEIRLWDEPNKDSKNTGYESLVKVNISNLSPFDRLINQTVSHVRALNSEFDQIAGINIEFSEGDIITFVTSADENYLFFNDTNKALRWGFYQIN